MSGFSNWITNKFLDWQRKQGQRKTIEDFAAYVGVSRPLMNLWMNGDKKPGTANIKLLVEIYGEEVYDALDISRPDPFISYVQKTASNLNENQKNKVQEMIAKYLIKNEKEKTDSANQHTN